MAGERRLLEKLFVAHLHHTQRQSRDHLCWDGVIVVFIHSDVRVLSQWCHSGVTVL
jgi:hypothetical protein